MTQPNITVLKLGGSVLKDETDLPRAVHEIYRHWRRGSQVVAVVSAFGGITDGLIERSRSFGDEPQSQAVASLLFTGEATSAALLTLALDRAGVPARLLSPGQLGLRTAGDALDAEPIAVDADRVRRELEHAVVVVSGFAGLNADDDLTLLGRGGTDFTALFLADRLGARCVLLKDVDGLYRCDPSHTAQPPQRFATVSYETAERLGGGLVQAKAVRFASEQALEFEIAAIGSDQGTIVGRCIDKLSPARHIASPIRIALLGCGTVGGGVYQRLSALPGLFEIAGVINLDPAKAVAAGIDEKQIRRDTKLLIEQDCDVVIELIGGLEPARSYIEHALRSGRHVITANKALLAEFGDALHRLAEKHGVTIRYSASVGGALPALEAVAQAGDAPRAITGIINGTCNFIFDKLASGADFKSAVELAQIEGFAEADPSLDLNGTDAAQKLILLVRESFGVDLPLSDVHREGIDRVEPSEVREAASRGNAYRLIADCRRTPTGIQAVVKPFEVPGSHHFAQTRGADNCLVIEDERGGRRVLRGRGAGRYATTEAVMADLFDVHRSINNAPLAKFLEAAA